jgi:hypothetical protein
MVVTLGEYTILSYNRLHGAALGECSSKLGYIEPRTGGAINKSSIKMAVETPSTAFLCLA